MVWNMQTGVCLLEDRVPDACGGLWLLTLHLRGRGSISTSGDSSGEFEYVSVPRLSAQLSLRMRKRD